MKCSCVQRDSRNATGDGDCSQSGSPLKHPPHLLQRGSQLAFSWFSAPLCLQPLAPASIIHCIQFTLSNRTCKSGEALAITLKINLKLLVAFYLYAFHHQLMHKFSWAAGHPTKQHNNSSTWRKKLASSWWVSNVQKLDTLSMTDQEAQGQISYVAFQ